MKLPRWLETQVFVSFGMVFQKVWDTGSLREGVGLALACVLVNLAAYAIWLLVNDSTPVKKDKETPRERG